MTETGEDLDQMLGGFAGSLGLTLAEASGQLVRGTWSAGPDVAGDPDGRVHPGVHSSVVETLASIGAALHVGKDGQVVGVNNTTDFMLPDSRGPFESTATPVQQTETQQLWLVETVDSERSLVSRGHVRLQTLTPRT